MQKQGKTAQQSAVKLNERLTDISEIMIDTREPIVQRLLKFTYVTGSPYSFRVRGTSVKVLFSEKVSLQQALENIVSKNLR